MTATTDSIRQIAAEFTQAADEFESEPVMRDTPVVEEARRASATLRLVAYLADEGIKDPIEAYVWLHAARRVLAQMQEETA